MSDRVGRSDRLQQHFQPEQQLLLPAAVGATICDCSDGPDPDPIVEETVTVWDVESKGNRYWDEATRTLHIVQTEYTDEVSLQYSGPTPPTRMEVYCNGRKRDDLGGGTYWTYDVTYSTRGNPYGHGNLATRAISELVTLVSRVSHWEFRSDQFTAHVKVYNPDQWKLKVKVPAWSKRQILSEHWSAKDKSYSYSETKIQSETNNSLQGTTKDSTTIRTSQTAAGGSSVAVSSQSSRTEGGTTTTTSFEALDAKSSNISQIGFVQADGSYGVVEMETERRVQGSSLSQQSQSAPGVKITDLVKLERNTTPLQIRVLDFIGIALQAMATFNAIKTAIQNNVPEIGWSWNVEFTVLEGEAILTWGWKEHTDHRVYYELGFGMKLVLFNLEGTIAVGIKGWGVQGQAGLTLQGKAELIAEPVRHKIGLSRERQTEAHFTTIEGRAIVTAFIIVKAGQIASVKGMVQADFLVVAGELKWSEDAGFFVDLGMRFDGVDLKTEITYFRFKRQSSFELMKPHVLGKVRFPNKPALPKDAYFRVQDVQSAVQQIFESNFFFWNAISFYERVVERQQRFKFREWRWVDVYVERDIKQLPVIIYREIAAQIWAHRDRLELTRTVIEGLLYGIRDDLVRHYGTRILASEIDTYLSSNAFSNRLKDAECPAKTAIADHGLG